MQIELSSHKLDLMQQQEALNAKKEQHKRGEKSRKKMKNSAKQEIITFMNGGTFR